MTTFMIVLGCLLVGGAAGYAAGRRGQGGSEAVTGALERAAAGDLTVRVPAGGRLPAAVNGTLDRVTGAIRAVTATTDALTGTSRQLAGLVEEMVTSAERSVQASERVLSAARSVHSNVTAVAAGAHEMGDSIHEISRNTAEAVSVTADAVAVTDSTSRTMTRLGESSSEIGDVIKVITSIAEQTNLLALNATIEAARAGDMGKGFAVVASEVKDLAQETATATEDITRRIAAIQSDTTGAVQAISRITEVIGRVNGFQNDIARAVEQQSVTTGVMTGGIGEAAVNAAEIADTMAAVATKRKEAAATVLQTKDVAAQLDRLSGDLTSTVGAFRLP